MMKLIPGAMRLEALRLIYRGAPVALDEGCHAKIAQSHEAIAILLDKHEPIYGINTGFGKLASLKIAPNDLAQLQRNIVLSHCAGMGAVTPRSITRLMLVLKLLSFGHGVSGVNPKTVALLQAMIDQDLMPVIPSQGSVGASGDLAPLSHMAAAMIGEGEIVFDGQVLPASQALTKAGLKALVLGPKEGLALLNGTQFSTAYALAGLFEAEALFQSALITGALSTEAAKGSDTPFDPRIHAVRGHQAQIETAAALRTLMTGSQIRASHLHEDSRVQDPYCLRCQPQVMGAVLGLLRQAGQTLCVEANGVSDNPLIFSSPEPVALSGGIFTPNA